MPEYKNLTNLKFEIQVRTVLQHAWAELSHDRNYKFRGVLPSNLERRLFLMSGLLEIADNSINELSTLIDQYISNVDESTSKGNLDISINSLSINSFIDDWSKKNNLKIDKLRTEEDYQKIINELKDFGITTLSELNEIIPNQYNIKLRDEDINVYGVIRDWMTISDPIKLITKVKPSWALEESDLDLYSEFLDDDKIEYLRRNISYPED